ncbi:FG-GAP-like repeat-containing protein [Pseudoalteromonas sp. CnMc7-15]|uniref:toxin TcdB middle/N-terminal domain-containing protein n=1 Tax=unclassified Pseudoalteromonas TaxID=194690 RepID=UPI001EF4D458|nr:toxin TcdB middle/N-terminal domain-containing protein [Pseudoalteromonas sp. CnMc7-15]MCG7566171.1 FG-GAP-like repeat-containing protein [Pseudoalteromonas sp. CnMc7-15]
MLLKKLVTPIVGLGLVILGTGVTTQAVASINSNTVVGATNAKFRVDESGQASYHVPLNLPSGTAGVTPELGLSYSSGNKIEGPVGVGWSISGMSSISRCPQTPTFDEAIKGVELSEDDRFCLDGKRLLLQSGGQYGEPNSTYQTEIDSFSTITARGGSVDTGPQYFVVEKHKTGETFYYGDITDLSINGTDKKDALALAAGLGDGSTVRSWGIKLIKDVKDNYILFNYLQDSTLGSFYLKSVEYTGNLTTEDTPYASVNFNYQPYNKGFRGYLAGSKVMHNHILDNIEITVDSEVFRRYQLDYENSNFIEERTLLTDIQECAFTKHGTEQCLEPLSFKWQRPELQVGGFREKCDIDRYGEPYCRDIPNNTDYWAFYESNSLTTGTDNPEFSHILDFNGDGFQDLLYPVDASSDSMWMVKWGNKSGELSTSAEHVTSGRGLIKENTLTIDFNGDGVRDLLFTESESDTWKVAYYAPHSKPIHCYPGVICKPDASYTVYAKQTDLGITAFGADGGTRIADVNGDGFEDIVYIQGKHIYAYMNKGEKDSDAAGFYATAEVLYSFSDETYADPYGFDFSTYTADMPAVSMADYNGDGRSDLIVKVTEVEDKCILNNPPSQEIPQDKKNCEDLGGTWKAGVPYSFFRVMHGAGTLSAPELSPGPRIGLVDDLRVADINGDGLSDLLYANRQSWAYRLSNGKYFLPSVSLPQLASTDYNPLTYLIDLNQDGRADLLHANSSSEWDIYFSEQTHDVDSLTFLHRGQKGFAANAVVRFGDINGDGKLSLLTSTGSKWSRSSQRDNINEYTIKTFTTSHGVDTQVTYAPLTDENVYFRDYSDDDNSNNTFSPKSGSYVVSQVKTAVREQGLNTDYLTVSYQYGGMLIHRNGRGSLGFQVLRTTDEQSGIVTETQYSQEHQKERAVLTGMPVSTIQSLDGKIISSAENQLAVKNTAKGLFPYIEKSTEKSYTYSSNHGVAHVGTTVTSSVYDDYGNATNITIKKTDVLSSDTITTTTINNFGNQAEQKQGRLRSTSVSKVRHSGGKIHSTTRVSNFSYYSDGMLKTSVVAKDADNALVTEYKYDAYGNRIEESASGNMHAQACTQTRKATSLFAKQGRFLKQQSNALNESVTYKYNGEPAGDAQGLIFSQTTVSPNGLSKTTTFDAFGRVSKVDYPDSREQVVTQEFCSSCDNADAYLVVTTKESGSPDKKVELDRWGRELKTSVVNFTGGWNSVTQSYDAQGRLFRTYEPNSSYYTEYTYDKLGRKKQVTQPNGSTLTYSYKKLETTQKDENSIYTRTLKNFFGEVIKSVDGVGTEVYFEYDAYSNLLSTQTIGTDTKNSTITNTYDKWGNRRTTDDPSKGKWTYTYNAFGEVYSQTSARGHITVFDYDVLGRKIRAYEATEGTRCWVYGSNGEATKNAVGKLVRKAKYDGRNVQCDASGATIEKRFTYNNLSLPEQVSTTYAGVTYTSSKTYDKYSRADVTTHPQGEETFKTQQTYNDYGYAHQLKNATTGQALKTIESMNARNRVTDVRYANGVTESAGFKPRTGWFESIDIASGTNALYSSAVGYDNKGNITSRSSVYGSLSSNGTSYSETFMYDDAYRLDERTISITSLDVNLPTSFSQDHDYQYDSLGNLEYKPGAGFYQYDNVNPYKLLGVYTTEQDRVNDQNPLYRMHYDSNGNVISDGNRHFTYSGFDKAIHISSAAGESTMQYGVDHELIYKQDSYQENGKAVTYSRTYVGNYTQVVRSGGEGALVEHKYALGNIIVTQRDNGSSDVLYQHTDYQGSVVLVTNQQGDAVSQAIYDPFGKRTHVFLASNYGDFIYSAPSEQGYTGHKQLDHLDIIHMKGRIYDATLGRFLQADPFIQAPLNGQNYNRYSYVLNNPMSMTDPSGHFFKWLGKTVKKYWRVVVAAVVSYVTYGLAAEWAAGWAVAGFAKGAIGNAMVAGAISGGVAGYVGSGSLKGAVNGALAGVVFGAIGGKIRAAQSSGNPWSTSRQMATHAMAGGILSEVQGGKFGHGFISAGIMKGVGKFEAEPSLGRVITQAFVGGTVSRITGGKFANGAVTSAIQFVVNEISYKQIWGDMKRTWRDYWSDANDELHGVYAIGYEGTAVKGNLGGKLAFGIYWDTRVGEFDFYFGSGHNFDPFDISNVYGNEISSGWSVDYSPKYSKFFGHSTEYSGSVPFTNLGVDYATSYGRGANTFSSFGLDIGKGSGASMVHMHVKPRKEWGE